ncbi:group II intron reverse transcriptase/maturase [Serratia sp. OS31]|uniref:group II intron reverse transcriptase/maturase n=1 Tax=Serratia sp. OS31 TaxID=2760844 RepID=UPI00351C962B
MTVLSKADAAPTLDWRNIPWDKCYPEVRKLQARIAKATREGRWRKVKALQWLLTHSFYAKALAVRRVTENQGKRTAGVDGITWSTPEAKAKGILSLRRFGYKPKALRRVYIPKSNGKLRPLGIPTMQDRAMQALHQSALVPVSETTADYDSYGFRPERSAHDAVGKLFGVLARKGAAQWVLEGDIKGCFDHISHDWMLKNICIDAKVLSMWLKSGYVDQHKFYPTDAGTPQGGIISPTLANLVLDGLEDLLIKRFGRSAGAKRYLPKKTKEYQINYVRYADDFVITGSSKELLESEVRPLVEAFLAERGLTLSKEKTHVTHISDGFDFLGQNIRKYHCGTPNEKLLIKPSAKNVKTFMDNIRMTIRALATAKQESVIRVLNPKIQGWANYHSHVVSKAIYAKIDHLIWRRLWAWACRRHPNKSKCWIHRRYFGQLGNRRHVFYCQFFREDGTKGMLKLRNADDVVIVRHAKIKSEANPYDHRFEEYFEARSTLKMERNISGKHKLRYLWRRQSGRCPVCGEPISAITRWHAHHLIQRIDGGSDDVSNLWLLHPSCHRQHHANPNLKWKLLVKSEDLA